MPTEYSQRLKLSNKHREIILKNDRPYTILEGAAQVGKSVCASLKFALLIENSKSDENIFIAIGFSAASARSNILEVNNLGLRAYFGAKARYSKYGEFNALKIQCNTGEKVIVIVGGGKANDCNRIHGLTASTIFIDEIDRVHQATIDEVKQRVQSFDKYQIIGTMNPNNRRHPIYIELDNLEVRGLMNHYRFTLDDSRIFLSEKRIAEIKAQYDPRSNWYKRYILGERVDMDNMVFEMDAGNIVKDFDKEVIFKYITVCDLGRSLSATAFIAAGLAVNRETHEKYLVVFKEYFHMNDQHAEIHKKSPKDYAADYVKFVDECTNMFNRTPIHVLYDGERSFKELLKKELNKNEYGQMSPKYVEKDKLEERCGDMQNYIFAKRLQICEYCNKTIESIDSATIDMDKYMKTGKIEVKQSFSEEGHGDCRVAVEYALTYFISHNWFK